jgi:integrase
LKLTPHQFRQLAGKLHLKLHPQAIETVRQVLGHTSTRTTLRSYAQVQRSHAYRNYDGTIETLRNEALRRPKPPRKPQTPRSK